MKVLSILVSSVLISGIAMTTASAMGRTGDPEFNHFLAKVIDKDQDGNLSKDEFIAMAVRMAEKEFDGMDLDDSKFLSSEEFNNASR